MKASRSYTDVIRGDITFTHDSYEDFIVVRSNGVVLYPLANAVDDRSMTITHIIRGEDYFPHAQTGDDVGSAQSLSRSGERGAPAVRPLTHARQRAAQEALETQGPSPSSPTGDQGYLPEAFVNYSRSSGWSPRGEEEIVPRATLIEQFRLEDVSHSPAFFDVKKLTHMNGEYIRALSLEEFIEAQRRGSTVVERMATQ